MCILLRNGTEVLIRNTPWIPNGSNFLPVWREGRAEVASVQVVSDLVDEASGQWDRALIRDLFSEATCAAILFTSPPG